MSEAAEETRSTGASGASLLSSLLSDPEVLARVSDTLSRLRESAPADVAAEVGRAEQSSAVGSDTGASDEISTATQTEENGTNGKGEPPNLGADTLGHLPDILALFGSGGEQRLTQHVTLLQALKPYLSPKRQEMIDALIRMSRLGELFKDISSGGKNVL